MPAEGTFASGRLHEDGKGYRGAAGEEVVFDGIFGAFFEGYWIRHTGIDDLILTLELDGRIEILIDRAHSQTGQRIRILSFVAAGRDAVAVPVPLTEEAETRLILTIRFLSDSVLSTPAWMSSTPPDRSVELTAVICTFNREGDVAAVIAELMKQSYGLRRVVVVNQGAPGLADRLSMACPAEEASRICVIDQVNLGGAGGFGRGMLESLADEECTHVLLMDDDIVLHAGIVARLVTILSYLRSDQALGGAMINRDDQTTLFTVGDILHPTKPEIRNLVDPAANNIAGEEAGWYLARHHAPDFNGWWFFAMPRAALAQAGLPLPLFIRGDDVEYGYRLTRAGIRTLSWPGLAVWHDPFHGKRHPWHYFYDRRNSLYLCEMHGRLGRRRLVLILITGFLNHLLRFDYERATCVTLGLRSFNDGAESLVRWNGADHAALVAAFASQERPASGPVPIARASTSRLPTSFLYAIRLIYDLVRSSARSEPQVPIIESDWRPTIDVRPRRVEIYYPASNSVANYAHDRRRTWTCVQAFVCELGRFLSRSWQPARLARLTSPDFWSRYTSQNRAVTR